MTRPTAKATPLACLTIGYQRFLMPQDKAMKVAELMQHAVTCEVDYHDGYTYTPQEAPDIQFSLVRANQVRMPAGEAAPVFAKPRLLR